MCRSFSISLLSSYLCANCLGKPVNVGNFSDYKIDFDPENQSATAGQDGGASRRLSESNAKTEMEFFSVFFLVMWNARFRQRKVSALNFEDACHICPKFRFLRRLRLVEDR